VAFNVNCAPKHNGDCHITAEQASVLTKVATPIVGGIFTGIYGCHQPDQGAPIKKIELVSRFICTRGQIGPSPDLEISLPRGGQQIVSKRNLQKPAPGNPQLMRFRDHCRPPLQQMPISRQNQLHAFQCFLRRPVLGEFQGNRCVFLL
jgi:hypothetical protein